jgi:hypothetical protein
MQIRNNLRKKWSAEEPVAMQVRLERRVATVVETRLQCVQKAMLVVSGALSLDGDELEAWYRHFAKKGLVQIQAEILQFTSLRSRVL